MPKGLLLNVTLEVAQVSTLLLDAEAPGGVVLPDTKTLVLDEQPLDGSVIVRL